MWSATIVVDTLCLVFCILERPYNIYVVDKSCSNNCIEVSCSDKYSWALHIQVDARELAKELFEQTFLALCHASYIYDMSHQCGTCLADHQLKRILDYFHRRLADHQLKRILDHFHRRSTASDTAYPILQFSNILLLILSRETAEFRGSLDYNCTIKFKVGMVVRFACDIIMQAALELNLAAGTLLDWEGGKKYDMLAGQAAESSVLQAKVQYIPET